MPIVEIDGTRHVGPAIDLRSTALSPPTVRAAVCDGTAGPLTVEAPPPGPVYEYVGTLVPDRTYATQAALAATARARGLCSQHATTLTELAAEIDRLAASSGETAAEAKQTIATTDVETLRERLDTLRGRIEEQRQTGSADPALVEEFRDLAATLSERKLETTAAEQAHRQAQAANAQRREQLERRLQLQDRYHNLERQARRELADRLETQFTRALAAVPGDSTATDSKLPTDVTAALAVARLAPVRAPVVVACGRFETAVAARAALHAPVVLVSPP